MLLSAIIGWATIGRGARRILVVGGSVGGILASLASLGGILTRLSKVSKWSPKDDPCLSSVSFQVEVGCVASFPQLVEHVDEGM